ncbi:uncharacterized protein LOC141852038 [Brevipalpus obovatus]|uniref:uncharacterized protein LOC141852038 n=1 Tax=Brevipalpus obovatus TaxID=246614 RepID=UPI003D9F2AF3
MINPEGEPLSGDVITDEPPISDVAESYPASPDEYRTIEGYPPIDHLQYHPDYHHHAPNPEDDYPTPWSPSTHFRCDEVEFPGYYADIEAGCRVWHICEPGGRHHRMSCPRETLFNQKHKVCDWWYNVECEKSTEYYHLNRDMFGGQSFYGHEYRNGPTRYPDQEEVVWGRQTSSYDTPRRSVISLTSNGMDAYEYPLNTEGESAMDYAASTKKTSRDKQSQQFSMPSKKSKKGSSRHRAITSRGNSERRSLQKDEESSNQSD